MAAQFLCKMKPHVIAQRSSLTFFWSNKTTFLKCPGNNPRVNAIKHFWTVFKDKVAEKHPPNIRALIEAIRLV